MKTIILRLGLAFFALVSFGSAGMLADGWKAFGKSAGGERRQKMEGSPQWNDGSFENPQPLYNDIWGSLSAWNELSSAADPKEAIPVVTSDGGVFATAPSSGLRITWFGHSSVLVEIDGVTVLMDPIWGERASPFDWVGPQRWYAPPVALEDLPPIDVVVISHDHYDHLDYPTFQKMVGWKSTFVVALGVGAHLEYWGVPAKQIVELDWWDETEVRDLKIISTPSRHASGRLGVDYGATLWCGFAFHGPKHRVYYSGDTGMFPAMKEIGERLGPFDVTMIEVGAYHRAWPDWHIGPEQAVRAHHIVGGKIFLPVHWGMWNLALHGWTEPAERVVAAAQTSGTVLAMPRPGESIEPASLKPFEKWWPDEPWQTAAEHPIVSTNLGDLAE